MRKNPFENVLPRLLTIKQTASYWGVSPNSFRKLVQNGIAPGPVHTPGFNRLLFDREQQDRAIDALRQAGRGGVMARTPAKSKKKVAVMDAEPRAKAEAAR